jgi:general L-amino acid transport system substrate-binding protein
MKLAASVFGLLALAATMACSNQVGSKVGESHPTLEGVASGGTVVEDTSVSVQNDSWLERIKSRGHLVCGTTKVVAGYGYLNEAGDNAGFEIDLCRADAVAVFNDPGAAEFRIIGSAAERGPSLASGEIDILAWVNNWSTSRDASWGGNFVHTTLYDGQGFAVPIALGINSSYELEDASVGVAQGTTTELDLEDCNRQYRLNMGVVTFETIEASITEYITG